MSHAGGVDLLHCLTLTNDNTVADLKVEVFTWRESKVLSLKVGHSKAKVA